MRELRGTGVREMRHRGGDGYTTLALRGSFEGQGFPPLSISTYTCTYTCMRARVCGGQEDYEGVRGKVAGVLVNKDEARGRSEYAWVAGGVCQGWREPGAQYL